MDGPAIRAQGLVYSEPNTACAIVAMADYDGDGKADLLWRQETSGEVFMMRMNGLAIAAGSIVYREPDTAWRVQGPGEYSQ